LEQLAYVLEELRDNYLFLSNPTNFNDPYDSALSTSYEQVHKRILETFGPEYGFDPNIISKYLESLGEEDKELEQQSFESLVDGVLSLSFGPGTSPEDQDLLSRFRNLVRVSCFAKNPNSVLMWSHYANQHKGICIEFPDSSMLSSPKFLELLHPVQYTAKLLDLFRLLYSSTLLEPSSLSPDIWPILAACHKWEEWVYEQEWRLVSLDPGSRKDPKFSLESCGIKPSRIIVGTRIDRANQAAIEDVAQKISVPVINARIAKDRFEIEFNARRDHSFVGNARSRPGSRFPSNPVLLAQEEPDGAIELDALLQQAQNLRTSTVDSR
jgi:hypothetical protein